MSDALANPDVHSLRGIGGIVMFVAVASGLAAVIAGIGLIGHTVQICGDEFDCTSVHPFRGAGWGILIGGLAQAFVTGVVGYLCTEMDRLRDGVPKVSE